MRLTDTEFKRQAEEGKNKTNKQAEAEHNVVGEQLLRLDIRQTKKQAETRAEKN